ncbi:dsRNA-binding protein 5 [Perilla frutescens var. frutescens]|nr:dsRNA-binding protein 5 [Perilla frutescens var. frutescens]
MFKNQLQELAQRSCFNLPSYACVREGPDHAPRFKASVNFNGEIFESPAYSTTMRQAEHAAAEVALNSLSARGPSKSLTARVLDETGVYKNLLQETAHRAGLKLPVYTTVRSGPGHVPVFTSTVELAGMSFSGEAAKTKKQAEKNAAIAAWSALKRMPNLGALSEQQREVHQENVAMAKWSCSSNVGRVIRRRDQPRGRMQRPPNQRDINVNPSSSAQKRPWKFTDPFLDPTLEHKNNSFLSLLPPPPPRTASKILPNPPKTNTLAPVKVVGSSSQVTVQESPPPPSLEERQRDDFEWINKISEAIKKDPIGISSPSSLLCGGKQAVYNQFGAENASSILDFSETSQIPMPPLFKIPSTCHNQMGLVSKFPGAQRFAPAVQIRSVIPVCAAPPPPVRPSSDQSPPSMKEASSSSSSSSSLSELASSLGKLKL